MHGERPVLGQSGQAEDKVGPIRAIAEDGPAREAAHHRVVGDAGRVEAGLVRHWQVQYRLPNLPTSPLFVASPLFVGFDATKTVAFGEGNLEQREDFQKVLEKCAAMLAGTSGLSSPGVTLAAATVILLPKNILMPGLVKLDEQVRQQEWEKRLRTEQTKAALTLFLAEHVHRWAGLKKTGQTG
jgi:hypothetical protein